MRPEKPFSAKFESLGSFLTKRANGSNVSPHKGYIYISIHIYAYIYTYIYVYIYLYLYINPEPQNQVDTLTSLLTTPERMLVGFMAPCLSSQVRGSVNFSTWQAYERPRVCQLNKCRRLKKRSYDLLNCFYNLLTNCCVLLKIVLLWQVDTSTSLLTTPERMLVGFVDGRGGAVQVFVWAPFCLDSIPELRSSFQKVLNIVQQGLYSAGPTPGRGGAVQVFPEPCALHPEPCTLNPAPCTLNPAPCTLNPAP